MLISTESGPDAEQAPKPGEFDVALVVVHGMGNAFTSQVLLEWAEPLIGRLDWLARDPLIGGGDDQHGVKVHESTLIGDTPTITATVKFPRRRGPQGGPRIVPLGTPVDTVERHLALLEARWSESFVPMTRGEVFKWALPFLWRAIFRMLSLFVGTMVLVPWYTMRQHLKAPRDTLLLPRPLNFIVDWIRIVVGTLFFVVIVLFVVGIGAVASVLLPLLSPLLLIPWFKNLAQGVIDGIVESIGDVATWKERPVRATAMRLVVRDALARARELVGDHGEVHVLAHSQGAAVATYTILEELKPAAYRLRRLTTVGAAVVLLGRENWPGRSTPYHPVAKWIRMNQDAPESDRLAWENHWATWDPFSAGPIADRSADARARWRGAYFPEGATPPAGPEEHAVHNTSQPFLDHSLYYDNVPQVVEPTALHLLGDEYPHAPAAVAQLEDRLAVIGKKSLTLNMFAALVVAAIIPGLPAVSEALAAIIAGVTAVVTSITSAVVVFFGGTASTPTGSWLLAPDGERLSTGGWILASVLLFALLVWVSQLIQRRIYRSRVWERCPYDAKAWLTLTTIPRAVYVLVAAAAAWLAIREWATDDPQFLFWIAVALLVVSGFLVVEPRFSPAPVVVPPPDFDVSSTHPSAVPPPLAPARTRPTIGNMIKDAQYIAERDERSRRALDPATGWSRFWARRLYRWTARPATVSAPLTEATAP